MGDTANQVRCNRNSLTRVREEVENLEYCLEGLCEEWSNPNFASDFIHSLALSQDFAGLTLEAN